MPSYVNETLYELSELFNTDDTSKLKIARIDCEANKGTCERIIKSE